MPACWPTCPPFSLFHPLPLSDKKFPVAEAHFLVGQTLLLYRFHKIKTFNHFSVRLKLHFSKDWNWFILKNWGLGNNVKITNIDTCKILTSTRLMGPRKY
jgi:hypothetical protein